MGRPRRKELVAKAEFARRCGIHSSQISVFAAGDEPRIIVDAETKKIDIRNPTNNLFYETYKKKREREAALNTADSDTRIKLADLMKAEADAKLKSIQARKMLFDLIDKRIVESTFLLIGKTLRELLLPQGERVSARIAALFENTDKTMVLKVQNLIDNENGSVLDEIKKVLKEQIQANECFQTLDDEEIFNG